jgi:UDP-glucose 4-epimerase
VSESQDQPGDARHLILGGCGFIGRHVALKLARLGHFVILADRAAPSFDFPEDVRTRIVWTRFDMAAADMESLVAGATTIHHYAWSTIPETANADPPGDLSANVVPTLVRAAWLPA